jgi:bifunctional DNase/RNase
MNNLWKFTLSILVIFAVMGCAYNKVSKSEPVALPEEIILYEVTVKQVIMDISQAEPTPIIVLANKEDDRQFLPIWVGMSEGMSINMALNSIVSARPGTHDLFAGVLGQLNAKLVKVIINDLRENTYIATITVEAQGETSEIDARPSDAIALALRCVAPVFVSEEVIRKNGWVKVTEQHRKQDETEKRKVGNIL